MNKGTKQAFQYVVPKTIPVLVGYLFLGAAYGILMQINGFGIGWTLISSIFIYAGSLQYLEVTLLVGLVSPVLHIFDWTAWICSLCGGLWNISFSYSGDACDHSGFDLWI